MHGGGAAGWSAQVLMIYRIRERALKMAGVIVDAVVRELRGTDLRALPSFAWGHSVLARARWVSVTSAMESFFRSLKTERTARKVYRMREQARSDAFDYIERLSNPGRRHSTHGYVSPIEFEKVQEA